MRTRSRPGGSRGRHRGRPGGRLGAGVRPEIGAPVVALANPGGRVRATLSLFLRRSQLPRAARAPDRGRDRAHRAPAARGRRRPAGRRRGADARDQRASPRRRPDPRHPATETVRRRATTLARGEAPSRTGWGWPSRRRGWLAASDGRSACPSAMACSSGRSRRAVRRIARASSAAIWSSPPRAQVDGIDALYPPSTPCRRPAASPWSWSAARRSARSRSPLRAEPRRERRIDRSPDPVRADDAEALDAYSRAVVAVAKRLIPSVASLRSPAPDTGRAGARGRRKRAGVDP